MVAYISRRRSGQSTVEYILLVTAVAVVALTLLAKNGLMAGQVNKTLKMPADLLNKSGIGFTVHPN